MSVNFGSKRVVTGAHYGLRDWLAQRVTAALVALFTFIVLAQVIFSSGPMGYETWAGIFAVATAFAGIWGMNFSHMPELEWRYGYPFGIAVIAGTSAFLWWRFRKAKWL